MSNKHVMTMKKTVKPAPRTPRPRRKKPVPLVPSPEVKTESAFQPIYEEPKNSMPPVTRQSVWRKELTGRDGILIISIMVLTLFCAWLAWDMHGLTLRTEKVLQWYDSISQSPARMPLIQKGVDSIPEKKIENTVPPAKSAENARKISARAETRSYMVIKHCSSFLIKVGEPVITTIDFINIGKSRAYNVRAVSEWKIGNEIDRRDMMRVSRKITGTNRMRVEAGRTQTVRFGSAGDSRVFLNADSLAVFGGSKSLFVFGFLKYTDKFGEGHFLSFAYKYNTDDPSFLAYKKFNNHD